MGDGKNLKKYLDEKGTNVRKIAKATGISATTLYSIIQKDSNIRFDFALRPAVPKRCQKETPANVCYSQEYFLPAFDLFDLFSTFWITMIL